MVMEVPNEGMPIKRRFEKGDLLIQFIVDFPKSYFAPDPQIKVNNLTNFIEKYFMFYKFLCLSALNFLKAPIPFGRCGLL